MPSSFSALLNPLLGGLAGGFTGLAKQQEMRREREEQNRLNARQSKLDTEHSEDRARSLQADQVLSQHLRNALMGDQGAQAEVIRVRPDMADRFVKPPTSPRRQFVASLGGVVNEDDNTFEATPGVTPPAPEVKAPVLGSPAWREAMKYQVGLTPPAGPTNVYLPSVNAKGETTYTVVPSRGPVSPQNTGIIKPQSATDAAGGTDASRLTAAYVQRMEKATETLDQMETNPTFRASLSDPLGSPSGTGRIPIVGNMTMNKDMQVYSQAQREWVRAKLRKESGASIPNDEMQKEIETYFAQPMDSDEAKVAKAASRKEVEAAMRGAAGNAYHPLARGPRASSGNIDLSVATEDQRDWDAAVEMYGKDRVLREVGPRP